MNYSDLVKTKQIRQDMLTGVLVSYCRKYIVKRFASLDLDENGSNRVLRTFQKDLTYIAAWSDSRVDREYEKFCKWSLRKRGISERELFDTFADIISLSIQILVNKEIDVKLSVKDLFFKSMKRIARHYYENPSLVKSNYRDEDGALTRLVETLIHTFVPLQDVIDFIKKNEDHDSHVSYDFNNSERTEDTGDKVGLIVEKQKTSSDGPGLRYIGSEEIYKEYYHSEEEKLPVGTNASEEKQINLKISKRPFVKN